MASGDHGSIAGMIGRLFEAGTTAGLGDGALLERFLARGDDSAFEAILRRHGPMVLGVCRRILDDPDEVADAFQATFLVLVKKARSIRDREALATWLHGVARRVAVRARVDSRRRLARERSGAEGLIVDPESKAPRADRLELQELRSAIDGELERLPARYRGPVILCDLEGWTHEQAAAQLGCPVGTVKSRLSRGREQLRARLVRRGLAPSAALIAATLAADSAQAVPVELANLTLAAASRIAGGGAVSAGASSAGAARLTKGVLRSMLMIKLQLASAVLAAAAIATTGVRALVGPASPPSGPKNPVAAARPQVAPAPAARPDAPPAERGVVRSQLSNGLKIVLRPIKGSPNTAMVVVYAIGGDHDPQGLSGLGHTIEHVYLTSAAGDRKARTTEELSRGNSGGANGQTGDRYTVFSARFPLEDLDRELADAAARMAGPRVTEDDLERERPRLIQEVQNMFDNFAALAAMNNARELVRPSPAGGRHGGRPEQLRAIGLRDIQARLNHYYKPRNATIALAGDFDPPTVLKAIARHFDAIPSGEAVPAPQNPGTPRFFVPVRPRTGKADEAQGEPTACLAYPAPAPDSPQYPAFLILIMRLWAAGDRLGGSGVTGSPVYFTPLDDGAVVAISASLKGGETPVRAFARIEKFVADTIEPKLEHGEAAAVKEQLSMILGLGEVPDELLGRNPYGVAFSLVRRDQIGLDPARLARAIDAVTDADLHRVAAEVFAPTRHAGALAGAFDDGR